MRAGVAAGLGPRRRPGEGGVDGCDPVRDEDPRPQVASPGRPSRPQPLARSLNRCGSHGIVKERDEAALAAVWFVGFLELALSWSALVPIPARPRAGHSEPYRATRQLLVAAHLPAAPLSRRR